MFALFALNNVKEHPYIYGTIAIVIVIMIILIIRWVWNYFTSSSFSMPKILQGYIRPTPVAKNPKKCGYKYTESNLESMISPEVEAADYNPSVLGVDRSVHEGHAKYAKDAFVSKVGNVADMVIKDSIETPGTWIGLRRPSYFNSVKTDDSSWQTGSSFDSQLNDGSKRTRISFY